MPIHAKRPHGHRHLLVRHAGRSTSLVLGLLVLLGLLTGCGASRRQRGPRVSVTVATVERRPVPLEIVATGTVEPIQNADVGSQVGGVITRIEFREGQEVQAGQPLIQLDPRLFRAALDQAQGVLARDRAQWRTAQLDAQRAVKLLEQNLLAQADYDQKMATAEALQAAVSADSAAVENARLNLQYATIRAPISGRTGDLTVHVGDLVKAATSEALVTIVQLRPIRVRFTVPEGDLPLLQRYRGRNLRVLVNVGEDSPSLVGRLAFVDNTVDPASGTLLLKGEFANADGRLWPGEFVETRLVLTVESGAIVVPAPAVTSGQQGTYVYVVNPDSTVTPRPVKIARTSEELAVVASGVQPGEVVVTDGQFRLSPGARVLVRRPVQEAQP